MYTQRFSNLITILLLIITTAMVTAQTHTIKPYHAMTKGHAQGGQGPDKSYDGNTNTLYHTAWSRNGIPDTLEYYFSNTPNIKTLKYTPRQDGSPNGRWGEVEIWAATTFPFNFQLLTTVNWMQTMTIKNLELPGSGIDNPTAIRFVVKSAHGNFSSVAEMDFYSRQPQITPIATSCIIDASAATNLGDIKLTVSNGHASSYQHGENIEKSFDGNFNTIYHSNYGNRTLPITLNYNFTDVDKMDYIIYYPRKNGTNGIFGKIKVEAKTENGDFQTMVESYDCGQKNKPSLIRFPSTFHNPTQVKITVLSASNNFASASEIAFYKKRDINNNYQSLFTNNLYYELKPGITQNSIDTISDRFIKNLAQCIFNNEYRKKFRVQNYKVIRDPSNIRDELKTSSVYSRYQNPTGIVLEEDSPAIIFVDDYDTTEGLITLRVKDFADETLGKESFYGLKPGINKLDITNNGLGYIEYYSENPDLPDVKINFASGKVNGFLSYNDSFDEWRTILTDNATYPKVDVMGNYVGINILKRPLFQNALFNGKELLQKWDSIVKLQFHQMGLVKYNLVPRNKMFSHIESKGGYFASGAAAHFDLSWGECAMTCIHNMDLWGIPHEFGHQNQIYDGLKWTGTTEVTNNIYSAYASYLFDSSRLTRLETANNSYQDVNLTGNLYNIYHNEFGIKQQHIMSRSDVFERLIPFWQLQLFYAIAGAGKNAPTLEQVMANKNVSGNTDYANWLGITAQTIRTTPETNISNGKQIMNFTKYVSDAVQQDLTEFFTKAGFLIPFDAVVGDYTSKRITITQADIDEAKNYIASKGYPKPQSPVIHYISAKNMHMYKQNLALEGETGTGFTIDSTTESGKTYYKIAHNIWKNVVAFETIDTDNNVLFVTTYATGDTSNQTTMVLFPENAVNIYAVGADGKRTLILAQALLGTVKNLKPGSSVKIGPNPVTNNLTITIENDAFKHGKIINVNGQVVKQFPVTDHTVINIENLSSNIYFVVLERTDNSTIVKKVIVNRL